MDQARLLLVEDHRDIAEMVFNHLEQSGFILDYAADGLTGLHLAATNRYDLIVLDLMLPGLDGLELCKRLRNEGRIDTPILMLTARDTLEDRVTGLDVGADDYLVKPFDLRELVARVRALLRRNRNLVTAELLRVDDLTLDTGTWQVERAGQVLNPTPIGLRLLTVLMKASPRVLSRSDLEQQVWGETLPDSDSLRSHMYNLRKVIDKPFDRPLLHTLPGTGYCIRREVSGTERR
jgi:DNA-binding response OmpR family regulator